MKYLKYLCSSLLLVGALGFAGCGSDGDTRADGDRNVAVQVTIDREIKVEGVVRAYKTGAPLDTIEVRLYQGGVKKSTTTASKDGHYAFAKVKVSDDKSVAAANNAANQIQLEFVELKVKNATGGSGSTHYSNGTTTASYPDSRIEFAYVSPEFTTVPVFSAADQAATVLAGNLTAANGAVSLVDAINEGRSYYWTDANTVLVRDVRLVQTGVLTGTTVDSETGLPVANAYVTISTDRYFTSPINSTDITHGDIVAVWQQTRITATLSSATGAFTFTSVPALDYNTSIASNDVDIYHIEATGYLENSPSFPDHANIRDDLVGTLGTILLTPIKVKTKSVTMKFVNQNLAVLSGVTVTFKYDSAEVLGGYDTALANGIATETVWVGTSNASGVVTITIPAISYNINSTTQDFIAKLSGYKLDTTFSAIVIDDDDLKLNLNTFGGVDDAVDLGIIKMIPDTKKFASEFRIQLIYKDAPIAGATVTGVVKYVDADVSVNTISLLISGDAVSDSNGFVTFNSTKIPASAAGLSVDFTFDVSLTGATSIVSALTGTYVVDDADDLDLQELLYTDATVTTVAENSIHQITIKDKALMLSGLEGYIVTGKTGGTDAGTVSFQEFANVNLALRVDNNGSVTTYFATTDANGYYAFLATAGVRIPVDTNNLDLRLTVLGDYVFSSSATNNITLDAAVGLANGVNQIDSSGTLADTSWLWQLNDTTANSLELKYDGKTLQVHTAAVEANDAAELGYHVVSLLKTVAGVSTLPVIQTNAATNKVYTFTQSQDDATGIQIVMSGAVDTTLPFEYNGLTGANLNPDDKTKNRLEIINFGVIDDTDQIPDGETFTFTATAAGRIVTIVPSGNANKFEVQVTYRLKVRVVSATGEVSDDAVYFRFFNKATDIFSTEKPLIDVSEMTNGDYWFLYNNVAADADNYKLGMNDADTAFTVGDVHLVLYKDGTGFSFATGGFQNETRNLNDIDLRFPVPTDLRTSATAVTTSASIATEIGGNFEVWAQAYTASGIILQHWTKVSATINAGDPTVGATNNFLVYEAGYLKIKADLTASGNIFEKALFNGNKVDLTVVHDNSQINPTAAKCLTLSLTDHAGVQAKSLNETAGDGDDYEVTLNESVTAVAATVPTMTTAVHGIGLTNVRYTAANKILADGALNFTNGTDITVSATTSLNVASANYMVDTGANSVLVLNTGTTVGTLTTIGNECRIGRELRFDADGATVTTAGVNGAIAKHSTIIHTTIPVISGTAKDYTYSNLGVITDNGANNGTTTAVDIDRTAGTALSGVSVGNVDTTREYDIKYGNLTDGRLKRLLTAVEANDIISVVGANFYLRVTANAANVIHVFEAGNFAADVRVGLGFDGTSSAGGSLAIAPQIKIPTGVTSDDTASGVADVVATNSNATTGVRGASNSSYAIIDSTTVVLTAAVQLYPGDSVILMTTSSTAADGLEPVYSASVVGSFVGNGATVVALGSVTQIRGTTEAFAAQSQAARATGFVFYGDQVTIGLGTGIVSLMNGAVFNTNGDAVSTSAFTDNTDVQHDGGKGFEAVK
jgi:hypothetical protein